ncbi:MAG: asparagine synthase (glutamine-hydrolyzing) [Rhodospirillales bacterium]
MCGVAGIILYDEKPDKSAINALASALVHRGPDGNGRFSNHNMEVVHTRLSIIDLETGDQPIQDKRGTVIVANGEIYNYLELRKSLGEKIFQTKSDCEPPLLLYGLKGIEFTKPLRGMYAIAIVDSHSHVIQLARDPFGIKPLYYTKFSGGVAFASEAGVLLDAGLAARNLNTNKRQELLQLQFTTGVDSIFENIKRVQPGQTLTLDGSKVTHGFSMPALSEAGPEDWSEIEALEKLDNALMGSVMMHQRSDMPYGMFLSGGVDSSVLLACMRDLNDKPVEAFTAGFSGTSVPDEREHAKTVAAATAANFHDVEFSEEDFWALLPEIAASMDDPAADYAILPTYKLGQAAAQAGLKVILSGEGGDELFGGYGRYRKQMRPWFFGGRKMRSKGIFHGLDLLLDQSDKWCKSFDEVWKRENTPNRTKLQIAQAVDCADWLPHDLLIKLDRCLMAHGVEGRTPFLDAKVAAVAMCLPDSLKVRGRVGKYLLRRWLDQKLPEARAFDKKRGFTVPVAEWMGRRGSALGKLVAAQYCIKEACDSSAVEKLFASLEGSAVKRNGQAAWVLLFYALWHRRHIEGIMPEGDVFGSFGG